ncbi:MAG: hypothetical protein CL850_04635 [Crocinitomicaceae bacterium]|nr:hypothetical protein [Crocinitomicaceae bacterium]|tara:strand:+ start:823 stop:1428 length:606 start_codon:yes stop_codon:yes gene_type:complete
MKYRLFLITSFLSIVFFLSSYKNSKSTDVYYSKGDVKYAIGMKAFGGVIFYLDKTKKHGLVVSTENVGGSWMTYPWGCYGSSIKDAEGIDVGTGRLNTNAIVNACDDKETAAHACNNYEHEGFSDWFLPSLEELEMIAENLAYDDEFYEIIQFDNGNYLSSTQLKNKKHKINYAWSVNLIEGYSMSSNKSNKHKIRAIRAF